MGDMYQTLGTGTLGQIIFEHQQISSSTASKTEEKSKDEEKPGQRTRVEKAQQRPRCQARGKLQDRVRCRNQGTSQGSVPCALRTHGQAERVLEMPKAVQASSPPRRLLKA